MAGKVLRFGGEALPAGTHTFYQKADGSEVRIESGAEVDVAEVANAQEFIDRKMAALVSAPKKDNPVI